MFDETTFYGQLVKGDLKGAVEYLKRFPEQKELYLKYLSVYEEEKYPAYSFDGFLNEILTAYQRYYRDVFYLRLKREKAEEKLRVGLIGILGVKDKSASLDEIDEKPVKEAFTSRGFHFLGGKTGGYFGPYIWTDEELKQYRVELPGRIAEYTVMLLDGFISGGWLSSISFGKVGTGGWTDQNGILNCVKEKYDLESEDFTVSLLKHEAQHSEDIRKFSGIKSEDLEYKAKLVELIYSKKRNLLPKFISQADNSDPDNGHAMAAERIAKGFEKKLGLNRGEMNGIPLGKVRETALELFEEWEIPSKR